MVTNKRGYTRGDVNVLKQVSINFDSSSYIEDTDWDKYEHDCLGHQIVELKDIHEELRFS